VHTVERMYLRQKCSDGLRWSGKFRLYLQQARTNVNTDRLNIERAIIGRYACYWSIGSVGAVDVRNRQRTVFGDKILDIGGDFRKLGFVAVLRSLIRILRASLAQIYTEKTEKYAKLAVKYAKLGKAAEFRSLYDSGGSNPVSASGLWSGPGSKVNQLVHVPTSVDTQHFIQIYALFFSNLAHRQTDRQTNACVRAKHIYLLLCRR